MNGWKIDHNVNPLLKPRLLSVISSRVTPRVKRSRPVVVDTFFH